VIVIRAIQANGRFVVIVAIGHLVMMRLEPQHRKHLANRRFSTRRKQGEEERQDQASRNSATHGKKLP
jgi:arylamine N-acetyltransferase